MFPSDRASMSNSRDGNLVMDDTVVCTFIALYLKLCYIIDLLLKIPYIYYLSINQQINFLLKGEGKNKSVKTDYSKPKLSILRFHQQKVKNHTLFWSTLQSNSLQISSIVQILFLHHTQNTETGPVKKRRSRKQPGEITLKPNTHKQVKSSEYIYILYSILKLGCAGFG